MDGGSLSLRRSICWRSILSRELKEMPVGIVDRSASRFADQTMRVAATSFAARSWCRPPGGLAVTEQLDVRRFVSRAHRQDIDLGAVEAVELYLGRPLVKRALALLPSPCLS